MTTTEEKPDTEPTVSSETVEASSTEFLQVETDTANVEVEKRLFSETDPMIEAPGKKQKMDDALTETSSSSVITDDSERINNVSGNSGVTENSTEIEEKLVKAGEELNEAAEKLNEAAEKLNDYTDKVPEENMEENIEIKSTDAISKEVNAPEVDNSSDTVFAGPLA